VKHAGLAVVAVTIVAAVAAPWLAPNRPDRRFENLLFAPPTTIHLFQPSGFSPHVYPWRLESRIERRFEAASERPVALTWGAGGVLVSANPDGGAPLLLLGADGYGRDVFSRLLHGARITLALAALATLGAVLSGTLIGGLSGFLGGRVDAVVSRVSELVLVLPAIYVALALRAVMPLVLPAGVVFAVLVAIFIVLGWPTVARGVRGVMLSEREQEYVLAARASGAGPLRILLRHLLPAARGYVVNQATLLLPAFIVAEATMSYIGLGFPDTTPTWGTMLQEASNVALLGDAPWTLAPAAAIFLVVFAVHSISLGGIHQRGASQDGPRTPVQLPG
jgi:peptide/nickel transport system permease protein